MSCLLVTNIFPPINGGSAVVYEKLARYSAQGQLVILAPRFHCATREELTGWDSLDRDAPYPVHRLKLLRPWVVQSRSVWHSISLMLVQDLPLRLKVLLYTLALIRKYRIKTLCIGELSSMSWLGLACRTLTGVRVINYIHGEEVTADSDHRRLGDQRGRYLRSADAVVAVSDFTRRYLIEHFSVAADKVHLITNGVDLKQFSPGPKSELLLQRYGLEGKKILLTVGRLIPRKGIDRTIEALPQVLAKQPESHYLVVGAGPYLAELQQLVARLGLEQHVTFAGRIAEEALVEHYRLCDLFLMPNREMPDKETEGFGLVFLEANACDKPVIAGLAGGAVEAVKHGYNGLSVEGDQVDQIAAAILSLIQDPELSQQLRSNGLALAQQSGFDVCAQRFQDVCKALVTAQS
ncbi:MAG: phosphatidylinositol alpha-1,6-mannosyltransferase [Motiliproteus sp.]|jgi:phosphatidylinositol alpha-1,6-mannosyltransferase